MLVLSRKADESIVIDEKIRIKVLGVCGNAVRLGVEAPREVPVRRTELRKYPERDESAFTCPGV
jgi:carbon storage regulator